MSLPQREGRPELDLSPDSTPNTASWDEDYGNTGMNPLNKPVKVRKGGPAENGWMEESAIAIKQKISGTSGVS
jgi:hypothetical protein